MNPQIAVPDKQRHICSVSYFVDLFNIVRKGCYFQFFTAGKLVLPSFAEFHQVAGTNWRRAVSTQTADITGHALHHFSTRPWHILRIYIAVTVCVDPSGTDNQPIRGYDPLPGLWEEIGLDLCDSVVFHTNIRLSTGTAAPIYDDSSANQ